MRVLLPVVAAALLLGGAHALAQGSLGYQGSEATCRLFVSGLVSVPQGVVQCVASHQGTFTADAADCIPTGCAVRAAGSARGTTSPPAVAMAMTSDVLRNPNAGANICRASAVQPLITSIACTGASSPVHIEVAPGACAPFEVRTIVVANPVQGYAGFMAHLRQTHTLCRDAAGTPSLG